MASPLSDHQESSSSLSSKNMAEVLLSSDLLETLPDAIVAVDRDGTIVQINSQTQALFGYTRDELIGQKIEILVPESYRRQHHHHRSTTNTTTRKTTGNEHQYEIEQSTIQTSTTPITIVSSSSLSSSSQSHL